MTKKQKFTFNPTKTLALKRFLDCTNIFTTEKEDKICHLLEDGAKPSFDNLLRFIAADCKAAADFSIELGVDINGHDKKGRTVLDAIEEGTSCCAYNENAYQLYWYEFLLRNDFDLPSKKGKSLPDQIPSSVKKEALILGDKEFRLSIKEWQERKAKRDAQKPKKAVGKKLSPKQADLRKTLKSLRTTLGPSEKTTNLMREVVKQYKSK